MAKRNGNNNNINNNAFPGLFDEIDMGLDKVPSSILSDIARHVAKEQDKTPAQIRIPIVPKQNIPNELPLGPVVVRPVPNRIMFMSFGSGSSGNCSYIGDTTCGFLIDAGVDPETVVEGLRQHGISMDKIKGICITHDHGDHMKYVYSIVRKYRHISLYCTPRAMNGIMRRHSISRRLKDYQINIYKEIPFNIGNFTITAFEVMHDGTDNAGFYVQHDDRAFTVATDLGCISERVDFYMRRSDYIMIESNYDLNMLRFGPYPEYLKARIRNVNGHLDNKVTAEYLAKIYTERLTHVFLCHLSQDNNTPEAALSESRSALEAIGIKVGTGCNTPEDNASHIQLVALPRFECSQLYCLRAKQ